MASSFTADQPTTLPAHPVSNFTGKKHEENSAKVFETWEDMPKVPTLFDVRPIGPPVPLSFACWISLSVLDSVLHHFRRRFAHGISVTKRYTS